MEFRDRQTCDAVAEIASLLAPRCFSSLQPGYRPTRCGFELARIALRFCRLGLNAVQ